MQSLDVVDCQELLCSTHRVQLRRDAARLMGRNYLGRAAGLTDPEGR